jgi:caffeoyl-CoA O-methyltransferase
LYTIDNNEEVMSVAKTFIGKSDHNSKIITLLGDASSKIKALNEEVPFWDLIWIDADKINYYTYYELCIDKLRPGGLIMADNVLWSGKVLDATEIEKNEDTRALHEFNTRVHNDKRVENVLLPLRDGIMMIRKL